MIKNADIILYNEDHSWFGSKIFSWAVKKVTDSNYTHGGVVVGQGQIRSRDYVWVSEALAEGVVIRSYSQDKFDSMIERNHIEIYRYDNLKDPTSVISNALQKNGRPYGYIDLIKILIYVFTGFSIYESSVNKLTCFEAIERIYREAGCRISDKDDPDLVFANDIIESPETNLIT